MGFTQKNFRNTRVKNAQMVPEFDRSFLCLILDCETDDSAKQIFALRWIFFLHFFYPCTLYYDMCAFLG